tara:strand:+ start:1660 stop:2607 length:948 start_codon:yes stop_codon:yes gene_type:complete
MGALLNLLRSGLMGMGRGVASRAATGRGIPGMAKRTFAREAYKRPKLERTGVGFQKRPVYESVGGPFGPTSLARRQKMETMPMGRFYRKPVTTSLGLAGAAGGLGLAATPFLPKKDAGTEKSKRDIYTPREPWGAPADMLDYADRQAQIAEEGMENLSKMLKYSMMISATGGDPTKFWESSMEGLKLSESYRESAHFAEIVRAVYKEGDMPKTAREAYERLAPLVGPEKAAILAGHQLGFDTTKTADERLRKAVLDALQTQGKEAAINVLTQAWGADERKAPDLVDSSNWREVAGQMIDQMQSGGGALIDSIEED